MECNRLDTLHKVTVRLLLRIVTLSFTLLKPIAWGDLILPAAVERDARNLLPLMDAREAERLKVAVPASSLLFGCAGTGKTSIAHLIAAPLAQLPDGAMIQALSDPSRANLVESLNDALIPQAIRRYRRSSNDAMRRPRCASETPEGSRFCNCCGALLNGRDTATRVLQGMHSSSTGSSADDGRFAPGSLLAGRYRIISTVGRRGHK